ncbi:FxSxx-COOH system tetratricopeptide repeat protein [Geodermatophilus sp. SYSU D01045]
MTPEVPAGAPRVHAERAQGLQAGSFNRQTNVFQVSRETVARHAVFLPPRHRVTGREQLLDRVRRELLRLTAGEDAGPAVLALHGLGGVGKSSLALEYAHRHWIAEDYGLVWWVATAEPATVATQLGTLLAAQLEIDVEGRDAVAATHAVLAARTDPWLLVLDNAESPGAVREFLPPAGSGHVLVTSRNPSWYPHPRLEVPDLDPTAAVAFLVGRTGDPDEVSAGQLAEELGRLPLGLEQAGAYISASPGATLASYLTSYRRHRPDLLGQGDPTDYEYPIARTWSLAFEALGPTAVGLLRLLACYGPDDVPLTLLLSGGADAAELAPEPADVLGVLAGDELALDRALAALYRYSLVRTGAGSRSVRRADADLPRDGRTVSVHRLVQAVVRDQLTDEQRTAWERAARSLLHRALPLDPEDPANWPAFSALLPHLLATLPDTDDDLRGAARFLHVCGDFRGARRVLDRAAAGLAGALGPEHPDTLAAQVDLARTLFALWDLDGARRVLEQVAGIRSRVLGPAHPATLTAQANLSLTLWHLGRWIEAREVLQRVIAGLAQVLPEPGPAGPPGPGGGEADLAALADLGDLAEARLPLERVLPARLRASGSDEPPILTTRAVTALSLADLRGLGEARRVLARMEQVLEQTLGPEHPGTLTTSGNLAYVLMGAGELDEARHVLERLVAARLRASGPEHPATLTAQGSLAGTLTVLGEVAEARRLLEQVVSVRERVLGGEHPDTRTAEANLALVLAQSGEWCPARRLLEQVVDGLGRTLGPTHPDTLTARADLAAVRAGAGEWDTAREVLERVLEDLPQTVGPDHPVTVSARENLAVVTAHRGA